jgi:2-dehydropantoate 2-reductase
MASTEPEVAARRKVKILIYGAGVIGTLYAARLQESGQLVTLLARGQRLANIRRHGLALKDLVSGTRSTSFVDITERLSPEDPYDIALITVRRDQLPSVMPALRANRSIPTMLFMLNNPIGSDDLVRALGQDRVLIGFPGAGGTLDGHVVQYALISQQPTTLGDFSRRAGDRVRGLAGAFRAAGFPTKISGDMDSWLKAHAFFVTSVAGAICLAGGDCRRLSEDSVALTLMTDGVREGFATMRELGLPVSPFPLKVLSTWLPQSFAVAYWRRFFASDMADYVFGRHVRAAPAEMIEIANDCRTILAKSGVAAPALRQLYRALNAYPPQAGEGQLWKR